ncbi:unnamed protein product [Pseudo-nitzschia multistriata]|uniref:Uncharacterized protein n=1 Tax=Pseudo-nitzschia multistriata TaxID=183589 RepID=A0A448ZPA4_9STRA|nr:unnamed protein product [Pseudo-nitzschia multistriata]
MNTNAILTRILASFCLLLAVAGYLKGAKSGEDHRILRIDMKGGMKGGKKAMEVMKAMKATKAPTPTPVGVGVSDTWPPWYQRHP